MEKKLHIFEQMIATDIHLHWLFLLQLVVARRCNPLGPLKMWWERKISNKCNQWNCLCGEWNQKKKIIGTSIRAEFNKWSHSINFWTSYIFICYQFFFRSLKKISITSKLTHIRNEEQCASLFGPMKSISSLLENFFF